MYALVGVAMVSTWPVFQAFLLDAGSARSLHAVKWSWIFRSPTAGQYRKRRVFMISVRLTKGHVMMLLLVLSAASILAGESPAVAAQFFNSSEPGCDGSDPN